ncbi:AMP-binding protein [Streptomyces sp. GQFP]|uniref:AMP-binding protein n=1 Tax=Streptomyces sp. GQFP TaxID=2907545 RepID=UPI001F188F67|nr:AMP-binding protein [Streptomyces sp. GQFP]UIX29167.1 AMP-binding protein [Streptomyces sp. GQFP]
MVIPSSKVTIGHFEYERWTITEALRENLARRPGQVALGSPVATLTYQEVWDRACELGAGLRGAGVSAGDRVLIMLDNSTDYALALVALNFIGAVAVPTNTMYKGAILTHVVSDSGATTALVEAHYLETLSRFDGGLLKTLVVRGGNEEGNGTRPGDFSGRRLLPFTALQLSGPAIEPVERHVWDPLLIGYTSGTTGKSKGVVLTNAHMFQAADPDTIQGMLGGEDEVVYIVCPMFHILGIGGMATAFIVGGSAYIEERFSASTFITDATRVGATHTLLVATMGEFLMHQPLRDSDAECSIRTAYMNPVHSKHKEFTARFGIVLRSSFGSTEVGGVIATGADQTAIDRISCGKPRPGVQIRLVDEHDIEVPVGEPGECIVRHIYPWTLCLSYLHDSQATANAWRNGWFHTGDLLRQDSDGYYYFVDRVKDAIRRRGENVSSMEVEREVLAHEEVVGCAAVAVDADEFEQEIKIFVVRRPDSTLTEAALTAFLIDRLPRYAVPRFVRFAEDLPRTPTGKARKAELRRESNEGCWDREAAGIVVPR